MTLGAGIDLAGRSGVRVNVLGTFFTLGAAAWHMVARGEGGSLVGMLSLAAVRRAESR